MIQRLIEWRPIPGWQGVYSVTRDGRVWAHGGKFHKKGADFGARWVAFVADRHGYKRVWLRDPITLKAAKGRPYAVHQLVLLAWGPPRPSPEHFPNHRDFNPSNNHISNLEWATQRENIRWNVANGRHPPPPLSKPGRIFTPEHRAAISAARRRWSANRTAEGRTT
jgi:hypothetical protein